MQLWVKKYYTSDICQVSNNAQASVCMCSFACVLKYCIPMFLSMTIILYVFQVGIAILIFLSFLGNVTELEMDPAQENKAVLLLCSFVLMQHVPWILLATFWYQRLNAAPENACRHLLMHARLCSQSWTNAVQPISNHDSAILATDLWILLAVRDVFLQCRSFLYYRLPDWAYGEHVLPLVVGILEVCHVYCMPNLMQRIYSIWLPQHQDTRSFKTYHLRISPF